VAAVLKRILVALGLLVVAVVAAGYVRHYDVIHVRPASFADTQSVLLPHIQVLLPEASGPRPAVLMFHGCGGVKPSLARRARELVELGFVAVIVDSYQGRGTDWEKVCAGRELFGDQRAADVLVALEYARNHAAIAGDQLFIAGYSHGGWAVLEALAYNGALPRGLTDSPAEPLAGLRGAIAWRRDDARLELSGTRRASRAASGSVSLYRYAKAETRLESGWRWRAAAWRAWNDDGLLRTGLFLGAEPGRGSWRARPTVGTPWNWRPRSTLVSTRSDRTAWCSGATGRCARCALRWPTG